MNFLQDTFEKGLSYPAFKKAWDEHVQTPQKELDRSKRKYRYYAQYNIDRAYAIESQYSPSKELLTALESIPYPTYWVVLTEDWCVDSAYTLPVIEKAASASSKIFLRIFPRDAHLDLMDMYLTRGARSIPKLIVFDEQGAELFQWGPRPQQAQALRDRLVEEGLEGPALSMALVTWYEEGGWLHAENELTAAVKALNIEETPV